MTIKGNTYATAIRDLQRRRVVTRIGLLFTALAIPVIYLFPKELQPIVGLAALVPMFVATFWQALFRCPCCKKRFYYREGRRGRLWSPNCVNCGLSREPCDDSNLNLHSENTPLKRERQDWRLMNQEKYLQGVKLAWKQYRPFREGWDHDHCSFCGAKLMPGGPQGTLAEGFATEDEYHWVCKTCFEDFKDKFNWTVE